METNKMKKIILALAVLAAVVCPVFAGESWIGVTTGPAFEMSNSDDYKDQIGESFVTDFNWDVNVEGAYYFNEAETMGIGAKLGFGFNFGTTFDNDLPVKMDNPAAGTRIAPAVTFQYRLGLTDALDLRMGAGLQYVYTICNGTEGMPSDIDIYMHNLEVVANADVAYSFGSFQVFGGIDLGVSVMCYQGTKASGYSEGDFITDGFQMSVTPRVGVSYAF